MKIVCLSNYFNHHQSCLSNAFDVDERVDYAFVSTIAMPKQRKKLGYSNDEMPPYVCESFLNEREKERAEQLLTEADVVIAGSAPEQMVQQCILQKKLLFRYSERPLKRGLELLKYPVRFIRWRRQNPEKKPIYMLCASAFTPTDYAKFGLFKNKTYKWGYFPETKHYDIDDLINKKSRTTILWCGRFLDWKHPEQVVEVASRLRDAGYDFELQFVGVGEIEAQIKEMVADFDLQSHVNFLGSMKPEQVRERMEKAGIYLFTSDRQEGWGAVLNESMNSGCAVVASHAIGAVPFLVEDSRNGLVYESGNVDMLYEKVKFLLDNPEKQALLGKNAYDTIINEWNAEEAAKRLVNLAEHILAGEKNPDLYENGPCSKAGKQKEAF